VYDVQLEVAGGGKVYEVGSDCPVYVSVSPF
jgi:hypothetical protein